MPCDGDAVEPVNIRVFVPIMYEICDALSLYLAPLWAQSLYTLNGYFCIAWLPPHMSFSVLSRCAASACAFNLTFDVGSDLAALDSAALVCACCVQKRICWVLVMCSNVCSLVHGCHDACISPAYRCVYAWSCVLSLLLIYIYNVRISNVVTCIYIYMCIHTYIYIYVFLICL